MGHRSDSRKQKAWIKWNSIPTSTVGANVWRKQVFKVDRTFEAHPVGQADADHGIKDGCGIKALGSYPEIRTIWVNHLKRAMGCRCLGKR